MKQDQSGGDSEDNSSEPRYSVDLDSPISVNTESKDPSVAKISDKIPKKRNIFKYLSALVLFTIAVCWVVILLNSFLFPPAPDDTGTRLGLAIVMFFLIIFTVIGGIFSIIVGLVNSRPSIRKPGLISLAVIILVSVLGTFLWIRSINQPYPREDILGFINDCEIYNINWDSEDSVIVNYIDKSIDRKTNKADPKYFNDYVDAIRANQECEIKINVMYGGPVHLRR